MNAPHPIKLYAYVDESGQDTKGRLFVVAVIVLPAEDQEPVRGVLERMERESGKGKRKWTRATPRQRDAYLARVFQVPALRQRMFYARFQDTTAYLSCVLDTVASAVTAIAMGQPHHATILIDGLKQSERHQVATVLRSRRVRVKKVRGLRDESDVVIRLADAVAGWVRHAWEARAPMAALLQEAQRQGVLREIRT